jgi:ribosomal protein L35AE/L33A
VYITSSLIYHGERKSTFGNAISGKVQRVRGANLDIVTNVVTALPSSQIDHTVSQPITVATESPIA